MWQVMTNEAHLNVSQICAATVLAHRHTHPNTLAHAHALQINTFLHLISPKHEGTHTHHEPGLGEGVSIDSGWAWPDRRANS